MSGETSSVYLYNVCVWGGGKGKYNLLNVFSLLFYHPPSYLCLHEYQTFPFCISKILFASLPMLMTYKSHPKFITLFWSVYIGARCSFPCGIFSENVLSSLRSFLPLCRHFNFFAPPLKKSGEVIDCYLHRICCSLLCLM